MKLEEGKIKRSIDSIRKNLRGRYITDHPIAFSLGAVSIIASFIFLVQPDLYYEKSISFLPGALEVIWFSFWLIAGILIVSGIILLSRLIESAGFFLLASVSLCYCIALGYQQGIDNLLMVSLIPAISIGALARSILLIYRENPGA